MTFDLVLADAIAIGELSADAGSSSSAAAPVVNLPQDARVAMRLKMVNNFDLSRRWGSILRRYFMAGREYFSSSGKVALCHDASRFKEDTLFSLLGSYGEGGGFRHDGPATLGGSGKHDFGSRSGGGVGECGTSPVTGTPTQLRGLAVFC